MSPRSRAGNPHSRVGNPRSRVGNPHSQVANPPRKITKMDGGRLNVQSFDVDFVSEILPAQDVYVLGLCVKLVRSL